MNPALAPRVSTSRHGVIATKDRGSVNNWLGERKSRGADPAAALRDIWLARSATLGCQCCGAVQFLSGTRWSTAVCPIAVGTNVATGMRARDKTARLR
jgi:hypothetical protein